MEKCSVTYLLQTIGLSLLIESYLLTIIDQFHCYLEVFEHIEKMEFCAVYLVSFGKFQ